MVGEARYRKLASKKCAVSQEIQCAYWLLVLCARVHCAVAASLYLLNAVNMEKSILKIVKVVG